MRLFVRSPVWLCSALISMSGAACGASHDAPADAAGDTADPGPGPGIDATADPAACVPATTDPVFTRSTTNPHLMPGQTFSDGKIDTIIADPDLHWDEPTQKWSLYYMSGHGASFQGPLVQTIRHALSTDGLAFSPIDTPALAASADLAAWDHSNTETPSVAYNPNAPADRRYLLMYSGAAHMFTLPDGTTTFEYGIGAAFSADGATFTRVAAALSPHGAAGQVLTGADAYPTAHLAVVADPEVVYRNGIYHVWFSSYACGGTAAGACTTTLAYGVGHATSSDGIHWTPAEVPVASLLRTPGNRATGPGQPSVIWDAVHCRYEMWMTSDAAGETTVQPVVFNNMAGVWHATSPDGVAWHVDYTAPRDLTWDASKPGEDLGLLTGADVAIHGSERRMVYVGFDDRNVPPGLFVPIRVDPKFEPGVFDLNIATRAP